jgi:hypothetical protein
MEPHDEYPIDISAIGEYVWAARGIVNVEQQ